MTARFLDVALGTAGVLFARASAAEAAPPFPHAPRHRMRDSSSDARSLDIGADAPRETGCAVCAPGSRPADETGGGTEALDSNVDGDGEGNALLLVVETSVGCSTRLPLRRCLLRALEDGASLNLKNGALSARIPSKTVRHRHSRF